MRATEVSTYGSESAAAVVLVRWPEERDRSAVLQTAGTPRLLLVGPGTEPPLTLDTLEDWIRLPAEDGDVRARVVTLALRARNRGLAPTLDEGGLLRYRGSWVALSPTEVAVASLLVERFGTLVRRDELGARTWPAGVPSANALRVHLVRLRRRVARLGLELHTVRGRGCVLQAAAPRQAASG